MHAYTFRSLEKSVRVQSAYTYDARRRWWRRQVRRVHTG